MFGNITLVYANCSSLRFESGFVISFCEMFYFMCRYVCEFVWVSEYMCCVYSFCFTFMFRQAKCHANSIY